MISNLFLTATLISVSLVNFIYGTDYTAPRKDIIIMESGEQIKGKINSISSGVIKINTDSGEKTIIREIDTYSSRDIVETGIIRPKRHAGYVKHFGSDSLKIETSSGIFEVKKSRIRKIIISHETTLPPLDL